MRSPAQPSALGQLASTNVVRPLVHELQSHQSTLNMPNNQLRMASQMQILQSWAAENNVDLSLPANATMVAQLFPLMQARMAAQHKANESNNGLHSSLNSASKPLAVSPSIVSENSSHANSPRQASGQSASGKTRQAVPFNPASTSVANCLPDFILRKCKNVVSKLQRRIDKDGQHIVPLLTDLWKRAESNLLNLRKIDKRVERLKYTGVMDLVFDVQLMLKGAMQFYGFSHEVRSEARKVHNLFFDILRIAFRDTDFEESQSALSFTGPLSVSASSQSPKPLAAGQSKRGKPMKEVDVDPQPRKMMRQEPSMNQETTRIRVSLSQKDSGSASGNLTRREASQRNNSRPLAHLGELFICKKKRKDREKVLIKPRSGSVPVSPAGTSRGIAGPGMASVSKDVRSSTPGIHHQEWMNQSGQAGNSGGGDASWANPVKRPRTDSARRRPRNL